MAADAATTAAGQDGIGGAPGGDEIARAKVNLFLHVRGRMAEGYHRLESFAVFPDFGDLIEARPQAAIDLKLEGPFAEGLESSDDNLVLTAAKALSARTPGRPGAALRLRKSLPIAAGVGGGSADAGAALRLLARLWPDAPREALDEIAFALGADAPVCLHSRPALMGGIGERLTPAPAFPGFWMVLVNPRQELSTGAVFRTLERRENPPGQPAPAAFRDLDHLVAWLSRQRNDLERPARQLRPAVGHVLSALAWDRDCRLARMSGSGATCFGIYDAAAAARAAAARIGAAEQGWWTAVAPVEAWEGTE